jgi:hypothetical protein
MIFLNSAADMIWLKSTHIPDLSLAYQSAVLYGNEDSPDRVDAYLAVDPLATDIPETFELNK